MIRPTDEQIAKAKSAVAARLAEKGERVARFMEIELDAPIDAVVIAAPFTLPSYLDFLDAFARDAITAQIGICVERVGFPEDVTALLADWPAASGLIAVEIRAAAGHVNDRADVAILDPAKPPAGLSVEEAGKLRAQHPGRLWSIVHPVHGVTLVCKAPDPDIYHTARGITREVTLKGKAITPATLHFVRDLVVWSSRPVDAILDEIPAFAEDLTPALWTMGGTGASARRRFL